MAADIRPTEPVAPLWHKAEILIEFPLLAVQIRFRSEPDRNSIMFMLVLGGIECFSEFLHRPVEPESGSS